jgi:DNA-binding IclR family transcriptional regulator
MSTSQTLDRGLAMLESIAWAAAPPTIDELAEVHGVHRSIAYRIVRTLEARRLVRRDTSGRCHAGVRLASLARGVRAPLLTAAVPALTGLANELGMTSFLVVRDGDEAVTIESIEPHTSEIHLAYRPGIRHPVELGAPGLALLAGSPLVDGERADVALARRRGWAVSAGEVVPGLASVAAPIDDGTGSAAGAVAVVHLAAAVVDTDAVGRRVAAAALSISDALDGSARRTTRRTA